MKKFLVCIFVFFLSVSGCLKQEKKMQEPSVFGNSNGHHFWDGELPLNRRVNITTASSQLQIALVRVRDRIDANFGKQEWTLVDSSDRNFSHCKDRTEEGSEDTSMQGWTSGLKSDNYKYILNILENELRLYGFKTVIDLSDSDAYRVNIHDRENGGYVGIVMNKNNNVLTLRYTTGCRPSSGPEGGNEPLGEGRSSASNSTP